MDHHFVVASYPCDEVTRIAEVWWYRHPEPVIFSFATARRARLWPLRTPCPQRSRRPWSTPPRPLSLAPVAAGCGRPCRCRCHPKQLLLPPSRQAAAAAAQRRREAASTSFATRSRRLRPAQSLPPLRPGLAADDAAAPRSPGLDRTRRR
jgi:hypothetical protein